MSLIEALEICVVRFGLRTTLSESTETLAGILHESGLKVDRISTEIMDFSSE
jgi:hypothetical protein